MHDDDILEGEVLPETEPSLSFPQAGRDLTPSAEMLAKGKHGNGAWNLTDGSVQAAYAETHQIKKEMQDERRHHFNEEAKDALSDAVRLHKRVIDAAHRIMDKMEAGEERVNGAELSILNKGLASAKELADRATGKARTSAETTEVHSTLAFLVAGDD